MFCDQCGAQVQDQQQFCHSCGKSFGAPRAQFSAALRNPGRVAQHLTIVGVLWIVYSIFHLLPSLAAITFGAIRWPGAVTDWGVHTANAPFFLGPVLTVIGGIAGVLSILGIIAGFALMNRQSWARTFLIVLAVLALLNFPFGTILGGYTLWVLLAGNAAAEFRQLAR